MLESSSGFGPQNDRLGVVKGEKNSCGPRTTKKQLNHKTKKEWLHPFCSLSNIASACRGSEQCSSAPREHRMDYNSAARKRRWLVTNKALDDRRWGIRS